MSSAESLEFDDPVGSILSSIKDIAVLPQVVFKIMQMSESSDASAAQLEKEIQVDPGFTAKVLSMANSAYFALPRRVTSIRDAVSFLGFKTLRQIAMSAGVFDMFVGKSDKDSVRQRTWWRSSLDTANCVRWMTMHMKELNPEEAYTAGLLHLLGKTMMNRHDSKSYDHVIAATGQGISDFLAENHFFGCSHVEITMGLCIKWGLPEELIGAVNYITPVESIDAPCIRAGVAVSHVIAQLVATDQIQIENPQQYFPAWALENLGIQENLTDWILGGAGAITFTPPQK